MAPGEELIAPVKAVTGNGRPVLEPGIDASGAGAQTARQVQADNKASGTQSGGPNPESESSQTLQTRSGLGSLRLSIEKDEATGKLVTRLIDPTTQEVIRQVPAEETIRIAEWVDRYLGLIVDRHR